MALRSVTWPWKSVKAVERSEFDDHFFLRKLGKKKCFAEFFFPKKVAAQLRPKHGSNPFLT